MAEWRVIEADVLDGLAQLGEGSAQTCVTSPPYYGLRDYGTDGQIGLEATPDEYVARLVGVFRDVRRVLRDDGTLWLNLGDSYGTGAGRNDTDEANLARRSAAFGTGTGDGTGPRDFIPMRNPYKPKDLLGIPWMVAFALRADGWYLRSDIIWAKPNPMPESVTDRPTKAHEYLFLLSKGPRYFYDADAIREPNVTTAEEAATKWASRRNGTGKGQQEGVYHEGKAPFVNDPNPLGRNRRSVWTVATQPFPGAHFATFPPKLIEPCILAGTSERACGQCGAPWTRVTASSGLDAMAASDRPQQRRAAELAREHGLTDEHLAAARAVGAADVGKAQVTQNGVNADATWTLAMEAKDALAGYFREFVAPSAETVGWEPSCDHQDDTGTCTVLDPFSGSGTTGMVALRHGRSYIGCELNDEYVALSRERIIGDAPLLNSYAEAA
jgi:DNA modification methylase